MPVVEQRIALLPAAGSGSRMASAIPKQYLPLAGQPVLRHTVQAFMIHPAIDRIVVVISPEDEWFDEYDWQFAQSKLTVLRCGGASRAESVRNGLQAIAPVMADSSWVLVHDAARPCLAQADLSRLLQTLADDPVGGILAVPVADTLKRAGEGQQVVETVPRDGMWQAQTPQMFRHGVLSKALSGELDAGVTDEASAIERLGYAPRLVAGSARNLKITFPADLALAEWIIAHPA
ncbi:2-C-methyl-D-erythritol 4-phosphate cytidylyltransferase [Chitinivorax tropicus]|uniref:2-C-methyl-D-erythritol 4-phosphate cytidylyltransferase n=1 Tax=Chitinivorax tropicus TaxID=714531 RepID=A0A840MTN6_9PROT|nr:2-C-methyl-D-erythritol 4-phosphate cytidylyltransferase [Chitinivorax tropicus]MBB5019653.1 2-C-methyl-D-erythritol 4-phosphate cytidylyltransferase [Chitinivorax tropicus]